MASIVRGTRTRASFPGLDIETAIGHAWDCMGLLSLEKVDAAGVN